MDEARTGRALWEYVLMTSLLTWRLWLASGVLARRDLGVYDFRWLLARIGVFRPSLVALLLSRLAGNEPRRNALRMVPALVLRLIMPGILTATSAPPGVAEFETLPSLVTLVMCSRSAVISR